MINLALMVKFIEAVIKIPDAIEKVASGYVEFRNIQLEKETAMMKDRLNEITRKLPDDDLTKLELSIMVRDLNRLQTTRSSKS